MMSKDYNEEVKKTDGLSAMEQELEKLWFENAQLRYQKEVVDR